MSDHKDREARRLRRQLNLSGRKSFSKHKGQYESFRRKCRQERRKAA